MERHTMFLDRKTQYCKDVSSEVIDKYKATLIILKVWFFSRDRQIDNKSYLEEHTNKNCKGFPWWRSG